MSAMRCVSAARRRGRATHGSLTCSILSGSREWNARTSRCSAAANSSALPLPARLEEIIYRGTNVDHRLRLADGQFVVATATRRECDAADAEVTIGFDPEALVILDD